MSTPGNNLYVIGGPLDQYFVSQDTGLPLAGGILSFFHDNAPNTYKPIYQLTGTQPNYSFTELPNPLTLSSVGTIQNASGDNVVIYYLPYELDQNGDLVYDDNGNLILDLYYVTCTDANGEPVFTRNAWPFIEDINNIPLPVAFNTGNQLANSQFSQVWINPVGTAPVVNTVIYNVSGATNQVCYFAPDWDFIISGTGSVTVTRTAIAGTQTVPTSPPYVINVQTGTDITACQLRQRLNTNSGVWTTVGTSNVYLSALLVGENINPSTALVTLSYAEAGGTPLTILSATLTNGSYNLFSNPSPTLIPSSTDSNYDTAGYSDILVNFPLNSYVSITSIQVVPVLAQVPVEYTPNSANRELAFMGDYFIPRLENKPISSILVGWDFPLNPAQFGETASIMNASLNYIWDQTMLADAGANITYAANAITDGLELTCNATSNACYIQQYLTGSQAAKIIGTKLSSNVFAYSNKADVTMRVYLLSAPGTTSIPAAVSTVPQPIVNFASDGTLTPKTGWSLIPRNGLDTATSLLPQVAVASPIQIQTVQDIGFNGWQLDSTTIANNSIFVIIVSFAYLTDNPVIVINSVSVVPGDIPTRPAPQSQDAVLLDCQQYYETSIPNTAFTTGTVSAATSSNIISIPMNAFNNPASSPANKVSAASSSFGYVYSTPKRMTVTPTFYSGASTTVNRVTAYQACSSSTSSAEVTFSSFFSATDTNIFSGAAINGVHGFAYLGNGQAMVTSAFTSSTAGGAGLFYHFIADARLGIV